MTTALRKTTTISASLHHSLWSVCALWLFLLFLLSTPCTSSAQEWARFRGPNGTGQSEATTIPVAWEKDEYLWKVELPGKGNSSPVLWGPRLFITSADPDTGAQHVLCFSSKDGRLLWAREFTSGKHPLHVQNTFASSTPTADEQHVYVAWATPEEFTLLALDHEGRDKWRANLGSYTSMHGFGTSPIVHGDLVIVTGDQDGGGFLTAVDKRNGALRWRVPHQGDKETKASYATPCVFERPGGDDELIVCGWGYGVASVDPKTGARNWASRVLERRPVSSPIVVDGLVLATCGDGAGNNAVVAVRPPDNGEAQPQLAYQIDRTSAPYVPSLVAKDSLVFLWADRGVVACIDAGTGKIRWRERVGGDFFSSPVRVADRIYCVSVDGEVVCLAASDKYELLGRTPLGETCRATPAVAGGRMFLRTESHLLAVGQP